jgi:hypothetical protein
MTAFPQGKGGRGLELVVPQPTTTFLYTEEMALPVIAKQHIEAQVSLYLRIIFIGGPLCVRYLPTVQFKNHRYNLLEFLYDIKEIITRGYCNLMTLFLGIAVRHLNCHTASSQLFLIDGFRTPFYNWDFPRYRVQLAVFYHDKDIPVPY